MVWGGGGRSAPGAYLAAAPQRFLRGSMPSRPSYSCPGTPCATARQAQAHPERQLPPAPPRGQRGAGQLRAPGLEGGTPLRQESHAHPRARQKFWDRWHKREIFEVGPEAPARLWLQDLPLGDGRLRGDPHSWLLRGLHPRWRVAPTSRPAQPPARGALGRAAFTGSPRPTRCWDPTALGACEAVRRASPPEWRGLHPPAPPCLALREPGFQG